MKVLSSSALVQVSGGKCIEMYNADIPLNYLPIVAEHLKLLNKHKFDAAAFLQTLTDAGLDPTQVTLNVSVYC